jgi:hypothetical protein
MTILLRTAAAIAAALLFQVPAAAQETAPETFPLRPDGGIPVWLVAGPFAQGTVGFGLLADVDAIGEASASPAEGEPESSPGAPGGSVRWFPQSPSAGGYLDLNSTIGWTVLTSLPEQVWWTKAGYGFVTILSPEERALRLLCGSNSELRVFLNGERVHSVDGSRTARADQDTVRLHLRKGENRLLVKIANSHQNQKFDFFGGNPWGWGGYFRMLEEGGRPASGLSCTVGLSRRAPSGSMLSTLFFRNGPEGLLQRFDAVYRSSLREPARAELTVESASWRRTVRLPEPGFGVNRAAVYLPAPETSTPVQCRLTAGPMSLSWRDTLHARPRYELHLAMASHTDIGYTNPQPVVKEMHAATLDSVVAWCERDPEFCWNIETVWQLKLYRESRSAARFERLTRLIRAGRVSLSPFLTNPYTGWVSEEEIIRSLADARDLAREHQFRATSAVYNDVPGLAWFIPQLAAHAGIDFLVCGLNEVYGGYSLQKSLPKAFLWEGPDGSTLLTYRTETYAEGGAYGLDRDTSVIAYRVADRLTRLESSGDAAAVVLLNAVFLDNGGVAPQQVAAARAWNAANAYPRFVFSTPPRFAEAFRRLAGKNLPRLRGDWTSAWDVLFQGEPSRVLRQRWAQHQATSAEKLSTLSTLLDPETRPLAAEISRAYESLLMYSGHGSGLEAGYGTPRENAITMEYREQYVREARLWTQEALSRSMARLVNREVAFEREGIIVWNPHSWRSTLPVTLELRDSSDVQYEVSDMGSSAVLPAFRAGHRLLFTTPGVPSLGFKKFSLRAVGPRRPDPGSELVADSGMIANKHFRVAFVPGTGKITAIRAGGADREILDTLSVLGFSEPLRESPFEGKPNARMASGKVSARLVDERPARVALEIRRDGELFERSTFALRSGSERLEITHLVNLKRLSEPATAESYGVAFPFLSGGARCEAEILGTTFDPDRDRLPGVTHEGIAMRRAASLSDGRLTVTITSPDCRVFFWKQEPSGDRKTLVANLVNNFPRAWNRNEEKWGTLEFRFAITAREGGFDASDAARTGWEDCTEPLAVHTLLRAAPAESSLVTVEGDGVILTTMKQADDGKGIILRLVNPDRNRPAEAVVASKLFRGMRANACTLLEECRQGAAIAPGGPAGSFRVQLKPNEHATLRLQSP